MVTSTRTEVDVWCASLNRPAHEITGLFDILAPDERQRARRFVFEPDGNRFVVARATLRLILAHYTGESARDVTLRTGPHGKPALAGSSAHARIEFNVAHSSELAAYAVARCDVGIDIERVRPLDDLQRIARYAYSPAEQLELFRLSLEHQTVGFFNCWTRKEAYLKGRGLGFSAALNSFDVSLAPGGRVALLADRSDPHEGASWTIVAFSPREGFAGAVAARASNIHLNFREL
jgi:4'-phosphopantetheinyl transferase